MGPLDFPSLKTPGGITTTLLTLATIWWLVSAFFSWYRFRHIPGPWLAKFSYIWGGWTSYSGKQHLIYADLENKYGSLVCIGPDVLLTSDVEVIKRMSVSKSTYNKAPWAEGMRLNPYHGTLFTTRDPQEHDRLKARLAPGYSGRDTPHLEEAVDQQVKSLVSLIRRKYLSDPSSSNFRKLPLINVLSYLALDVISKVALGTEFGCCASDCDPYHFYKGLAKHLPLMTLTSEVPWMRAIISSPTFLKYFGPKETDPDALGPLMK